MAANTLPSGTFAIVEDLTITRVGYGAMQLAGPGVFGPPKDRAAAIAVEKKLQWIWGTSARWDGYLEFQRRPEPMLEWSEQYTSLSLERSSLEVS